MIASKKMADMMRIYTGFYALNVYLADGDLKIQ